LVNIDGTPSAHSVVPTEEGGQFIGAMFQHVSDGFTARPLHLDKNKRLCSPLRDQRLHGGAGGLAHRVPFMPSNISSRSVSLFTAARRSAFSLTSSANRSREGWSQSLQQLSWPL
jgi:hypothetical protein